MTDTQILNLRRARVSGGTLFLQESAADEIEDRLGMVNRSFTQSAVVSPFPAVWQARFPQAHVVADTETLDLAEGTYDLVIHSLGLHWANDPIGQLIQCRRALRPDGLMIAATLGGQTLHELRTSLAAAEIALTGGLSPRVAPMGEIRDLGALLQRAGFAMPVADSITMPVEYRDVVHLMHDLRGMGETNALSDRHKTPPPRALFHETAAHYADEFATASGRVRATYELVFLTGWAPDANQPQPLRPGSARTRLADALNVPEVPLRD